MPLSRNVYLDKMSACHEGHKGSTDCTVGQGGSVNYHREVYHWWWTVLLMGVCRFDRLCGSQRD